ncbi:MAG: putative sulfate exporter family transporter [Myxacorys chilensis ATA2-1-KO14]|nr:putative sulfate exporter family transporter [Myxacorys chilensis ATA2-1-KO14]
MTNWISPPAALTLGILFALTLKNPFPITSKFVAKYLLQICVVLLGFTMNLAIVWQVGSQGALFAAGSIGATFWLGNYLRKWLKIPVQSSVLISAGTAICGGSAIAAVSSVINAAESEISIAMGTVFVLNAIALYVFPALGHAFHLTPTQFGTWAGVAIHDISSVVGAASHFGLGALETATAVKLSRSLWIIPISLIAIGMLRQPLTSDQRHSIQIPWFIGLFLLASMLRTFVPTLAALVPTITHFSTIGLTLTIFLIGTGLSKQALRAVGWKPMIQGVLLWVFISASSLGLILQLVH